MSREFEAWLAGLAARQHGVVTRAQLREAGLSRSTVGRRLRSGRFRRVHPGVYLVSPIEPPGARVMAAVLAGGPTALVSHVTAASHWELLRRPPVRPGPAAARMVHISVESANRGRLAGIRVHRLRRRLDGDERTVRDGIPITTPARTLVDVAGMVGLGELELAVARAEREGLVAAEALAALVVRYRGRRGMGALRAVLGIAGGPAFTRSEAEVRFLALVREAGLPPPEVNVRVGPYEVDFLWRTEGLAVEVDGLRYHGSRPRFHADRRRDAWLFARGIHVMRLSWRQIADEAMATAVQIAQALVHAA